MEIAAQCGFNRLNDLWIDLKLPNERTGNRIAEFLGAVFTFKQSLLAFGEAVALFVKLTQHVQP